MGRVVGSDGGGKDGDALSWLCAVVVAVVMAFQMREAAGDMGRTLMGI